MRPALGLRKPEITAKSVVLPAPLGPISAVIRAAGADSEAPLTASNPPKPRETFSTERSGSATRHRPRWRALRHEAAREAVTRVGKRADEAARRKANDQNER